MEDVHLHWKTDTQASESKTITLDETIRQNKACRLVIKEAT